MQELLLGWCRSVTLHSSLGPPSHFVSSKACTFLGKYSRHTSTPPSCHFPLGPSYKRGPPKGYIHAIEQRWHQVESILGAILASPDPQVQDLMSNLRKDDLARDILKRVDAGPFVSNIRLEHIPMPQ